MSLDDVEIIKKGVTLIDGKKSPFNLGFFMDPLISYVDSFRSFDEINNGDRENKSHQEVLRVISYPFTEGSTGFGVSTRSAFYRVVKIALINFGQINKIKRTNINPPLLILGEVLAEIRRYPRNPDEINDIGKRVQRFDSQYSLEINNAGFDYDRNYGRNLDDDGEPKLSIDKRNNLIKRIALTYGKGKLIDEETIYRGPIVTKLHILGEDKNQMDQAWGMLSDKLKLGFDEGYGSYVDLRPNRGFPKRVLWAPHHMSTTKLKNNEFLEGNNPLLKLKEKKLYSDLEIALFKLIRDGGEFSQHRQTDEHF